MEKCIKLLAVRQALASIQKIVELSTQAELESRVSEYLIKSGSLLQSLGDTHAKDLLP